LDSQGAIQAQHVEAIKTWRDSEDSAIYEQSTDSIWQAIKTCFFSIGELDLKRIKGFGIDSTCSLAVTDRQGRPVSISKTETERNVILWMDHRAEREAEEINATKHHELVSELVYRRAGGQLMPAKRMPLEASCTWS
jgi:ribulose kinase